MPEPRAYGLLVFPGLQLLDFAGPWDTFATTPGATVLAISKTLEPVRTSNGLCITPTTTYADVGKLDIFCVPGGVGIDALLNDAEAVAFVREQAARSTWLTSVCTGSLLLGAAGLLEGKKATTHWASFDLLSRFGAIPMPGRYVRDAGIDMALTALAAMHGDEVAQASQLHLEYAPSPPFNAGHPDTAPAVLVERARTNFAQSRSRRSVLIDEANESRKT